MRGVLCDQCRYSSTASIKGMTPPTPWPITLNLNPPVLCFGLLYLDAAVR